MSVVLRVTEEKKTPTNQSKKQQNISKINKEQFGIQNAMQTVFVD